MKHLKNNRNKIIFSTGAFLFLIGFLGMVYNFWINPSSSASDFLPKNTIIFTEFKTDKLNLEKLNKFDFPLIIDEILAKNLLNISSDDLIPWLGEKAAVAWLPDNKFIFAAKYRDRKEAQRFMKKFLVPEEKLSEKNFAGFSVYSPQFSSEISFVLKDGWLITASSEKTMQEILSKNPKLTQNTNFSKISEDLPKSREIFGYADFVELAKSSLLEKNPFLKALSNTIPAGGITLAVEKDGLNLSSKFLTTKGVFSKNLLKKTPKEIIPELAKYAPQDVLFFMNGYDLPAKYQHTKSFLQKTNPQLALIFEGILRAEFKKLLGENFDFQTDFLEKTHGQYALIFNFAEDSAEPFTYFTLITKFAEGTSAENNELLQKIIKDAQQLYSTKIAEKKLPDGTIRQELVLADPDEIKIVENSANSWKYFTAETETNDESALPQQKFSYGFINNFLVFSNHEQGVKDAFSAFTEKINLTQNEDFRESVLFKFPASESYGFVNTNKLAKLKKISRDLNNDEETSLNFAGFWKKFRNISFARKTFSDYSILQAIFKQR